MYLDPHHHVAVDGSQSGHSASISPMALFQSSPGSLTRAAFKTSLDSGATAMLTVATELDWVNCGCLGVCVVQLIDLGGSWHSGPVRTSHRHNGRICCSICRHLGLEVRRGRTAVQRAGMTAERLCEARATVREQCRKPSLFWAGCGTDTAGGTACGDRLLSAPNRWV